MSDIPYGYCHCGCGEETDPAKCNDKRRGHIKGIPLKYRHGHNNASSGKEYIVDENGCWIWQRYIGRWGYGQKRVGKKVIGAHIAYYERVYGPVPIDKELDHLCHKRRCVNPNHLEPVPHYVNCRRGYQTKITPEDADRIKHMLALGLSNVHIANHFVITDAMVSKIKCGHNWKGDQHGI